MGISGQSVVSVSERLLWCAGYLNGNQLTMCKGSRVVVCECESGAKVGQLLPEEDLPLALCCWRLSEGNCQDITSLSSRVGLQAVRMSDTFLRE